MANSFIQPLVLTLLYTWSYSDRAPNAMKREGIHFISKGIRVTSGFPLTSDSSLLGFIDIML